MDEELKQRLVGYLDSLETAVKTGGDFVVDNAPETVRQWIQFSLVEHGVYLFVGIAMLAICYPFSIRVGRTIYNLRTFRKIGEEYEADDAMLGSVVGGIAFIAVGIPGLTIALRHLGPFLKCWLAPNVFILEEVAKLVK